MSKMYAAYGSNLSVEQMAYRCPDAKIVGRAEVLDYRLLYKGSLTGAYATIEPEEGMSVPILVWEISESDEKSLDRYEGYPRFYYKKDLQVEMQSITGEDLGETTVMAYIMDEKRHCGIPSTYYEDVLREGYERFGFDPIILDEAMSYTIRQMYSQKLAQ